MGKVDLFVLQQLYDAVLEQNIDAVFNYLQHPSFEFRNLFEQNKEWYFVVIENILEKLTKLVRKISLKKYTTDCTQKVRVLLNEVIEQANGFAVREASLEIAVNEINAAIKRRDPLTTLSVLMKQNTILNNMPRYLLNLAHDENATNNAKIESLAVLMQLELETVVQDKGQELNFEELSTALEVLESVVQLNEAVENSDSDKVLEILSAPAGLWENLVCSNKESQVKQIAEFYSRCLKQKQREIVKSCGKLEFV